MGIHWVEKILIPVSWLIKNMKKLLLFLLLSLSFGVSAYTVTYDNFGRGSDGSQCEEDYIGGIVCSGGGINGRVTFTSSGYNSFYGSDGSECGINTLGNLECNRKNKVSKDYNTDPNAGRVSVEGAKQAGVMVADGLFGILEALVGSGSNNNNKGSVNSSKPRLFDFGTTVQFNDDDGGFNIVSSSNGFKCESINNNNICTKGSYKVSYSECGYFTACGTDGTKFTLTVNYEISGATTSFGSTCSIDRKAKVFRCR